MFDIILAHKGHGRLIKRSVKIKKINVRSYHELPPLFRSFCDLSFGQGLIKIRKRNATVILKLHGALLKGQSEYPE